MTRYFKSSRFSMLARCNSTTDGVLEIPGSSTAVVENGKSHRPSSQRAMRRRILCTSRLPQTPEQLCYWTWYMAWYKLKCYCFKPALNIPNLAFSCEPSGTSSAVIRRKLVWFGRVTRHDNLSKTILQGILEGGRRRGRQRKCWMDNVKE